MNSSHGSEPTLPNPGDVVAGKYRIESTIGSGGMGVVLGAQDTSLGRPVAIKFLSPQKARREGSVPRFIREARAAASIQSEHVVRVYEVGELPGGSPFIVMEHLRGADLSQVLASRGPLPIEEAVDYVLQACEAIGEAHALGIVHRDLKPQNLFVAQRPDGGTVVKVLDFGISKAIEEGAPHLTSTDQVMGTPLYMSPEQVRSLKNVDHRSDIWALGSILFELLTASPIFEAPSVTALCAMIAIDPPVPLRARRPSAPPELEGIILRCLHKDPAGRFADVAALAAALVPYASERGRVSATRIARVVHSASGSNPTIGSATPAASASHAFAVGPTAMVGSGTTSESSQRPSFTGPGGPPRISGYPPPAIVGSHASSRVPPSADPHAPPGMQAPYVTTQSTWQQTGAHTTTGDLAATGQPKKSSSPVVVALLGVLTGVAVLGLLTAGAYLVVLKRDRDAQAKAEVDAAAQGAPAPATASAPSATAVAAAPSTTAAPTATAGIKKSGSTKDAGPAPASPSAAPASKPDEQFEAKKRMHTGFCAHNKMNIQSTPATDTARLQNLKASSCLPGNGPDGSNCERLNCRLVCAKLNDNFCAQQVDNADRTFPAKY
ncbi:MAG: protein kinase [Deltaproteobacteria bacterium]|nr:protein kinase [Deltaproteobacteria bacterium]